MDESDLSGLIARARAGDEAAASDLLRRFEPEVRTVVRGKLPRALRPQLDSMDLVQSVWKSVLIEGGPELPRFENARHFMRFLAGVVQNKVYEKHRSRTSLKYDIGREEPLYVRRGNRDVPREVVASDPSPSEGAQAHDRLSQLLKGSSDRSRLVVELRQEGLTCEEIAARLDIHESAVRRVLTRLQRRLEVQGWQ